MLLNLIGSIAIASAVAFGGAVSNAKQDQAHIGAESTSVKSAYYDPNGEYGAVNGRFYNYTSSHIYQEDDTSEQFGISYGEFFVTYVDEGRDGGFVFYIYDSEADIGGARDFHTSPVLGELDFYVNGIFYMTLEGASVGYYTDIPCNFDWAEIEYNSYYIWVFDHQEVVPEETNIVGDIAEGLTGGIVPIAQGLGSGFQDLMRNIFLVGHVDATTNEWVADGLSTFGIVVVCFAGLALALGLSRWIVNFVGSLGARDR